ncbi:EamA family transporter [Simiduia curdlanivorans]|uniref:EamA family transporter n=1 Tax=Simiduia curdlanivorans TaxID=1492769 RepID=A0ABV8VB84_9GAMM|nr:EamA family transporter [Simiduia curdlanivorans]MDN3639335.1 EamA family transporter [Simiduia curdlanivorans]
MSARDLVIGIALMVLWGFNFSVIQLGVEHAHPTMITAARFFFAAIPAIFFVPRPQVPTRYLVGYGLSFGLGVWGMMTVAMKLGVSPGMAGLLLQLSVVSSLFLGWLWLQENIAINKVIGVVLALMGLAVSLFIEDGSLPLVGLPFALVAAMCWSFNGILVKRSGTREVFSFCVWGMLFAPIPLCLIAWLSYGDTMLMGFTGEGMEKVWFSVLFQAYPTTLFGYWVWNRLVVKYPLSTVAPLTFLTPVTALLGGVIFYGEAVGVSKLFAFSFILLGLLVSQMPLKSYWPRLKQI